ncbi:hypothetical protein GCM10012319_52260 [Comamonas sp. KCTC 72670]|nr:hypothetical protein GCM10012319_52260 [Comamonas sp. KCTC 72670]
MTDTASPPSKPTHGIKTKVLEWLNTEGYPLEFKTARAFEGAGFHVRQGIHVRNELTGVVREIDVEADITLETKTGLLRIIHPIECKWSNDKPWVSFTSKSARIGPGACINQTMATPLGAAMLWCLAGNKTLQATSLFEAPSRPGFSGKQCFSKNDLFYSAMQSITTNTDTLLKSYDRPAHKNKYGFSDHVCIAFPCIVVEGELFEVFHPKNSNDLDAEPVNHIRIHWRGAEARRGFTHIDIIRASYASDFSKKRAKEIREIAHILHDSKLNIEQCQEAGSLNSLRVENTARGTIGLPPLLYAIKLAEQEQPPPLPPTSPLPPPSAPQPAPAKEEDSHGGLDLTGAPPDLSTRRS